MFKFILYFICVISILPEYTFASLIDNIQSRGYTIQDGNICRDDKIYHTSSSDLTLEQSVKNIDKVIEKIFKENWLSEVNESKDAEHKSSQSYALNIMRHITTNNKNIGDMTLQLAAFYALPLLLIRDNQLDRFAQEKLNLYNYFRCHSAVVDIQNIENNLRQYFFNEAVDSCSYIESNYASQCKDSLNKYVNVKIDENSLIKNKTFTDYWNINEFFNRNCDVDSEPKIMLTGSKKLKRNILVSSLDAYRREETCSYIKTIEYKDGIRGTLIVTYNDNQETVLKVEPNFLKEFDSYLKLANKIPNAIRISHVYMCQINNICTFKNETLVFEERLICESICKLDNIKQEPLSSQDDSICITFQPYVNKYMSGCDALQSEHAIEGACAFGRLVGDLVKNNINHQDLHLNNWLYNPEDKKCYLIDIDTTRIGSWTNLYNDIFDNYIENMTNIFRTHLQSYTEIFQDTRKAFNPYCEFLRSLLDTINDESSSWKRRLMQICCYAKFGDSKFQLFLKQSCTHIYFAKLFDGIADKNKSIKTFLRLDKILRGHKYIYFYTDNGTVVFQKDDKTKIISKIKGLLTNVVASSWEKHKDDKYLKYDTLFDADVIRASVGELFDEDAGEIFSNLHPFYFAYWCVCNILNISDGYVCRSASLDSQSSCMFLKNYFVRAIFSEVSSYYGINVMFTEDEFNTFKNDISKLDEKSFAL